MHGLPDEIQKLIAKVVERTRLRKAERTDIERELAAHFRDGLASGKSVSQLVEAFGESKVSARNIRAGAIAKRSPLDRTLRQASFAVGWAFIACIVLYAGSIGYLWLQAPVIRFDALKRLHDMLPKVAAQDRAWPVYKQGLIALADTAEDRSKPDYPLGSQGSSSKGLAFRSYGEEDGKALPNHAAWATQSKVLRARRAGVDTLVRAASMPAAGFVPEYGNHPEDADIGYDRPTSSELHMRWFAGVLLPNVSVLWSASRLVGADALLSIEDGDGDRFVRDIDAMIRISHHVEEGKFTVSQTIGTTLRDLAFTRIILALEWRPEALRDDQLQQLAQLLQAIPASDAELDLATERLYIEDFLQQAYTDNGSGDGVFNPIYGSALLRMLTALSSIGGSFYEDDSIDSMKRTVFAPSGAYANASRKEVADHCDAMIRKAQEQSQRPLWQQDFSFEKDFQQSILHADAPTQAKWAIPRMLMPGFSNAAMIRRLGESQCDAAKIAVALTRFRRAHGGAWPGTLDDLVPAYINAVPPDPWTGNPIHYEVQDGRANVWSEVPEDRQFEQGQNDRDRSGWMNSLRANIGKRWIWFRGDDKLERWKETN